MVVDSEKEAMCPITFDSAGESEKASTSDMKPEEPAAKSEDDSGLSSKEKPSHDDGELVEIQHSATTAHGTEEASSS